MLILSFIGYSYQVKKESFDLPAFKLSDAIKTSTSKDDLVVIVNNGDPIHLYHSWRKGWIIQAPSLEDRKLDDLKNRGAKYLAGEKSYFESEEDKKKLEYFLTNYSIVRNEQDFYMIDLEKKQPQSHKEIHEFHELNE